MIEVIPAIIPDTLTEITEKLTLVKGLIQKVQIDFIDGKYAPPITWPFNLRHPEENFRLPFCDGFILEADLFIKHPEDFLEDFMAIGIRSFVIHLDSTHYIEKCIHNIKEKGLSVGLGIKPFHNIKELESYLEKIDFVQFMGNDRVGYNGVELDRTVLSKISHFRIDHFSIPIQIDIGVNEQTAHELVQAGVTGLVSGSEVFNHKDIAVEIEKLKNS